MQSDFNSFMNEAGSPPAGLLTKEDYSIAHGHIVKWGVVEILPLKSEIEALGERNPSIPIHKQVPWEAGIVMRVLALKSKDHRGNVRNLYAVDPNGAITLPYGPKYMGQWVKTDTGEVERGWARQYNTEGKRLSYDFPPNWLQLRPIERFALWMTMLGGRFGFAPSALSEGSVFYGYFTRSKSKNGDKWYSDVKKIYKGPDDVWHDDCPTGLETIDVNVLRALQQKIDDEFAGTDFNYGQNGGNTGFDGNGGHSYGRNMSDPEAGF